MNGKPTGKSSIDYSKELSKYLLLRWTLLGESCLDCKIPLVENKKEKIIFCVSCQRNFIRESELATGKYTLTPPQQPKQTSPLPTLHPQETKRQPTIASSTIPLDDGDLDWTPPTPEEMRLFELHQKKTNEISAMIGQKLLQGWALVEESCPNPECIGSPLMRDREKRLYCVSCKTYFTHPTESNSSKKQKSANETKTTISPTQPDTSNVPSRDKSQRTKQEQNINENRQQKQQLTIESQQVISFGEVSTTAQETIKKPSEGEVLGVGSHKEGPEIQSIKLKQTIDVLFRKIHEVSQELEKVTATDIKRATKLTKFISTCGKTIDTLLRVNTNVKHQFNE